MDFFDTPDGLVTIPLTFRTGAFAEQVAGRVDGDNVQLYFWQTRATADPTGDWGTEAAGEVIASVVMNRHVMKHLPRVIEALLDELGEDRQP